MLVRHSKNLNDVALFIQLDVIILNHDHENCSSLIQVKWKASLSGLISVKLISYYYILSVTCTYSSFQLRDI